MFFHFALYRIKNSKLSRLGYNSVELYSAMGPLRQLLQVQQAPKLISLALSYVCCLLRTYVVADEVDTLLQVPSHRERRVKHVARQYESRTVCK